jgi:hypothetical protein
MALGLTTYRPRVRNARPGIQLFRYTAQELFSPTSQRRVTESTRFLLSGSTTVILPVRSSQMRKRVYTCTPTRRNEMNASDGAFLPVVAVVVVTLVLDDVTTADAFETAAVLPADPCAITSARSR